MLTTLSFSFKNRYQCSLSLSLHLSSVFSLSGFASLVPTLFPFPPRPLPFKPQQVCHLVWQLFHASVFLRTSFTSLVISLATSTFGLPPSHIYLSFLHLAFLFFPSKYVFHLARMLPSFRLWLEVLMQLTVRLILSQMQLSAALFLSL